MTCIATFGSDIDYLFAKYRFCIILIQSTCTQKAKQNGIFAQKLCIFDNITLCRCKLLFLLCAAFFSRLGRRHIALWLYLYCVYTIQMCSIAESPKMATLNIRQQNGTSLTSIWHKLCWHWTHSHICPVECFPYWTKFGNRIIYYSIRPFLLSRSPVSFSRFLHAFCRHIAFNWLTLNVEICFLFRVCVSCRRSVASICAAHYKCISEW